MQWIIENWLLLGLGAGMIAMHLFGHAKHGKRGGGQGCCGPKRAPRQPGPENPTPVTPETGPHARARPPDET